MRVCPARLVQTLIEVLKLRFVHQSLVDVLCDDGQLIGRRRRHFIYSHAVEQGFRNACQTVCGQHSENLACIDIKVDELVVKMLQGLGLQQLIKRGHRLAGKGKPAKFSPSVIHFSTIAKKAKFHR
jgi:hypothetical protein